MIAFLRRISLGLLIAGSLLIGSCRSAYVCQQAYAERRADGLIAEGGWVLAREDGGFFKIEQLCTPDRKIFRFMRNDQILDDLVIPPLRPGEVLLRGADCGIDVGEPGRGLILIAAESQTVRYGRILKAWQADRLTGKFERIEPRGLTCTIEEGY